MLSASRPANLGVYSLTTLDTPHKGTVGADLRIAYNGASAWEALTNPLLLLAARGPNNATVPYLTTEATASLANSRLPEEMTIHGRTNGVRYYAHAGDANTNGNQYQTALEHGYGIIECPGECGGVWTGVPHSVFPLLYKTMQSYQFVRTYRIGPERRLAVRSRKYAEPYPLNDFIVTVDSAQYPGFLPARGRRPDGSPVEWKKNHSSIGDAEVGHHLVQFDWLGLQRELQH